MCNLPLRFEQILMLLVKLWPDNEVSWTPSSEFHLLGGVIFKTNVNEIQSYVFKTQSLGQGEILFLTGSSTFTCESKFRAGTKLRLLLWVV